MRRNRKRDEGSATVWTVFAAAALCAVFLALLGVGQAVTVRHRAGGAADLAALAAADQALQGQAGACAVAGRVATAQRARLVRCSVTGEVADVSVEAGRSPFLARVRARAGPSEAQPPHRAPPPHALSVLITSVVNSRSV
ncbi:Rv3654c family TadE-like protein [Streptomyces lydicus]|uniref:Rv3654c family TadE-like protein n=1 Tax=Streptomyces lydicus TaxID=47763 RepID=UPI0033DBF0DC